MGDPMPTTGSYGGTEIDNDTAAQAARKEPTRMLMPHFPPVPQPQRAVTEPDELMALHYADVYHSLLNIRRQAQGIETLFGSAVARELYVDVDTALDHLRSVWGFAADAINRERTAKEEAAA